MCMHDTGSLWGKWDLQVQTIIDDDYVQLSSYADELKKQDGDLWEEYVAKVGGEQNALLYDSKEYFTNGKLDLRERCVNYTRNLIAFLTTYRPDLRAILVTDHNYDHDMLLDVMVEYSAKSDVKIIPGVEINVGGVHLLAFFDKIPFSKKTYSEGIKTFQSNVGIQTRKNARGRYTVTQHGIDDVIGKIREHHGNVIFAHCNSDNGLFQERQNADRENLADIFNLHDTVILQTQNKESADYLPSYIGKNKHLTSRYAITIASDSRKLSDIGRPDKQGNYQWIKADPTFKGLSQILTEPDDRVYVGKSPDKLISVDQNKDKYIKSIDVRHRPPDANAWFDQTVPLNPGLVAIIGKKGSGKSALTDILGLAGSTHVDPKHFSFLTQKKFLKRNLAAEYQYNLTWADDSSDADSLSRQVDPAKYPEKVKYLPQKYVESICDEFGVSRTFQEEIDRVIFSYVPVEKRLERTTLKELLSYKDAGIEKSISGLKIKLGETNVDIGQLEAKQKGSYSEMLDEKLKQQEKALKNLTPPAKVPKPKKGGATQAKINTLNGQITALDVLIEKAEQDLIDATGRHEKMRLIESQISGFKDNFADLRNDTAESLKEFGLEFDKIFSLKVDTKPINEQKRKFDVEILKHQFRLNKTDKTVKAERNLVAERTLLVDARKELKGKLDENDIKYQDYLEAQEIFKEKQQEIIGKADDNTLETIESLKAEKEYVGKQLTGDLDQKYKDRTDLVKQIFDKKGEKIGYYEEIYKPLTDVLAAEKAMQVEADSVLEFNVEPVFDKQRFVQQFEQYIDQRGKGNFRGRNDGVKRLMEILDAQDLKSAESVLTLIDEIINLLRFETIGEEKVAIDMDRQLTVSRSELYDFLFSIDFIEVQYNLRFNGKDLSEDQFSPGEKGALLLIFYLLIEKGKVPLIIDQPEENLDNESVFDLLVPYIRRAKKERQVILVTHNPNLAVVCDAEQIIHTSMDKAKNTIRYSSGSLEDIPMNKRTSAVLEGTLPAFDVRNVKYYRD